MLTSNNTQAGHPCPCNRCATSMQRARTHGRELVLRSCALFGAITPLPLTHVCPVVLPLPLAQSNNPQLNHHEEQDAQDALPLKASGCKKGGRPVTWIGGGGMDPK